MTPAPTELVIKERDRDADPGRRPAHPARDLQRRKASRRASSPGRWISRPPPARRSPTRLLADRPSSIGCRSSAGCSGSRSTSRGSSTSATSPSTRPTSRCRCRRARRSWRPRRTGRRHVVLLGRGQLQFAPPDIVGADPGAHLLRRRTAVDAEFDAVFVRIRPSDFAASFGEGTLTPRPPPTRRRPAGRPPTSRTTSAGRCISTLNDLSRDRWSLLPQQGDFIAEIRTRKFGNLTYARASPTPEDVSFFDRRRRKNIAVYTSKEARRAAAVSTAKTIPRLRHHAYDLEADFTPERLWIDGRAQRQPHDADAGAVVADAADCRAAGRPQRLLAASSAG